MRLGDRRYGEIAFWIWLDKMWFDEIQGEYDGRKYE